MIRWCAYCQRLLAEVPPLTNFDISHGMCARCAARLEAGESLVEQNQSVIHFYRALFDAASAGDQDTCAVMVQQAHAAGFSGAELLVGLVQPALGKIGELWETGKVSVADEHRFSAWCARMLAMLDSAAAIPGALDLLIVQARGNRHELGPRMAAQALADHGISAHVASERAVHDLLRLSRERQPAWIGFSCALPEHVESALEAMSQLAHAGFQGGVILSGQALRRHPTAWVGRGAEVCLTIEDARELILRGRERL